MLQKCPKLHTIHKLSLLQIRVTQPSQPAVSTLRHTCAIRVVAGVVRDCCLASERLHRLCHNRRLGCFSAQPIAGHRDCGHNCLGRVLRQQRFGLEPVPTRRPNPILAGYQRGRNHNLVSGLGPDQHGVWQFHSRIYRLSDQGHLRPFLPDAWHAFRVPLFRASQLAYDTAPKQV